MEKETKKGCDYDSLVIADIIFDILEYKKIKVRISDLNRVLYWVDLCFISMTDGQSRLIKQHFYCSRNKYPVLQKVMHAYRTKSKVRLGALMENVFKKDGYKCGDVESYAELYKDEKTLKCINSAIDFFFLHKLDDMKKTLCRPYAGYTTCIKENGFRKDSFITFAQMRNEIEGHKNWQLRNGRIFKQHID